jgi:hypothetical protein
MIPVSSARCRNIRLKGVSTSPTIPLAICTITRADRAGSSLSIGMPSFLRALGTAPDSHRGDNRCK